MQLGGSQQNYTGVDTREGLPGCLRLHNEVEPQFLQPYAFRHCSLQNVASHTPLPHVRQLLNEPVDGFRRILAQLPYPHVTCVTRECGSNCSNYGNRGAALSSNQSTPWSSETYGNRCTSSHPFIPSQPGAHRFLNAQDLFHSSSSNSTHAQFQHANNMEKKSTSRVQENT
jgi:hypothetical protein